VRSKFHFKADPIHSEIKAEWWIWKCAFIGIFSIQRNFGTNCYDFGTVCFSL